MQVYHEFSPVFDDRCEVLILGSIPSVTSRNLGFYYMHPQNRFWPVLSAVFNEKITDKKAFCLEHHLALWDTCASCEITSSSDASIKKVSPNDLSLILNKANIKQIFTTGKKAHEIYQKYLYQLYKREDICLSSTSAANAQKSLDDLIKEYAIIKQFLT